MAAEEITKEIGLGQTKSYGFLVSVSPRNNTFKHSVGVLKHPV